VPEHQMFEDIILPLSQPRFKQRPSLSLIDFHGGPPGGIAQSVGRRFCVFIITGSKLPNVFVFFCLFFYLYY